MKQVERIVHSADLVEAGIDLNLNGVLDTSEVTEQAYICDEQSLL